MLDFSPEEQSTVWPFILPEIPFILNNSWHSALCATPFEVFFGRSSRHCSIADRGDVAVWPSDEFMAFMKDSRNKCESRTEKFEKSTYPTDFWGSGNSDSETDSETDGDMGKEALQKTVNCHLIQSENIGEIQRSLLELHTERRIIELTAIEGTEKKYYENYLLHAKKIKNQDFKCGDEVWFHHPEKYGMVVVPNIQGRVTEVLPCNYYRVSYNTLEGTECTATLYASTMVLGRPLTENEQCTDDLSPVQSLTLQNVTEKVLSHAVKMWESIHDFIRQLVKENSAEYSFLDELGLTEKANDLNIQVDLFCYACDCSFLATVAEDTELLAQLNRLFVSIMNFLKEAEYRFYFAGLCLWETSRSQSPVLLHLPFSQHSLPCFIEATHECFQCARRMQPCFHPCCKEWFQQVGSKCNYFQDNPDMVVTDDFKNTPHKEKESKRAIPPLENRLPPAKRKKASKKRILKGKQSSTKGKLKDLTQPPKQNDIRVFLPILSAKGSLFKERISSLQLQITPYLTSWKQLTIQSKQNLYCNVRYMAQVVGVHADSIIQSQVHISHHKPWKQSQGQSNYCGLCAINNAYSNEKLTVDQLDNIADDLWLRQIEQFSLDLADELQIQRDVNGFYSFEVLREVVECFGDQLLNLNELVQEPLVPSDFSSPGKFVSAALGKTSFPCTLIVYWQEHLHYTSIRIESTSNMWHLDSKQRKPRKLTMRMVQDIMIDKSCYTFVLVRPSADSTENPGKTA